MKRLFSISQKLVVAFLVLFSVTVISAPSVSAITLKTDMKCNVTEGKMMNWVTSFAEDGSIISEKWEEGTFFKWPCQDDKQNLIEALLITVLNWLAIGVSIAVVGGVIYGAVLYTSAGGNTEQTKRALNIIRNAFIALVMYFAMWAFLNWLVPGGLFN